MTAQAEYGMNARELKAKYDKLNTGDGWSEHPDFPHQDWAHEASELNTLRGYWEWVASEVEQRANEEWVPPQTPDPAVKVRVDPGPDGETEWFITQNLSDRWGEINHYDEANKPLEELVRKPGLLERLRSQMHEEETFIVRKDGKFGVLFESEVHCYETAYTEDERKAHAESGQIPGLFKPYEAVVEEMLGLIQTLRPKFPAAEFAVPDRAEIYEDRPAIWVFIADGVLSKGEIDFLGNMLAVYWIENARRYREGILDTH